MSKRKKRNKKQSNFELRPEFVGIVLIILSIMAYGPGKPLGIVGKLSRGLSVFLFGSLDWLFIALIL